jgi:hypothetical protein
MITEQRLMIASNFFNAGPYPNYNCYHNDICDRERG